MKKLILALSLLMSLSASALTESYLVSFEAVDGTLQSSRGFWDNGFQGPDAVCYVGEVTAVCGLFKTAEEEQKANYSSGEHGYFEVTKCEVDQAKAVVTYQRITDYDGTEGAQAPITLDVGLCK